MTPTNSKQYIYNVMQYHANLLGKEWTLPTRLLSIPTICGRNLFAEANIIDEYFSKICLIIVGAGVNLIGTGWTVIGHPILQIKPSGSIWLAMKIFARLSAKWMEGNVSNIDTIRHDAGNRTNGADPRFFYAQCAQLIFCQNQLAERLAFCTVKYTQTNFLYITVIIQCIKLKRNNLRRCDHALLNYILVINPTCQPKVIVLLLRRFIAI